MNYLKTFDNGLKLAVVEMKGLLSVACGVLVKTGSANESAEENGISHFIEHTMFKGTEKRSAFEISDFIDRIGGQINAYTSKQMTCYYTHTTKEHLEDSLEVLSDMFFNSKFDKTELTKEKGVVIEEINMSEDTPEDLCLDLLSESYFGREGLGQTILGSAKNVRSFDRDKIAAYMDKYYTADNVVIAVAGNVTAERAEKLVGKYFADNFKRIKSAPQKTMKPSKPLDLKKIKKIEQSHVALCMPAISLKDERRDALTIANIVLGGGMSSRLFQKIREDLGLCYSVYSYLSCYRETGVLEVYAGVNTDSRELAYKAIVEEIQKFREKGITEQEFLRGKEQLKSSLILGQESVSGQMQLYGRYALFSGEPFDFSARLKSIESITADDVAAVIRGFFDVKKASTATVGPKRSALTTK
ncbi:MAG: insulinase family protein [Clostridia bacterium]|nr:insulinase family protein [Clostridia bacterium]